MALMLIPTLLDDVVRRALAEDLSGGDLTTQSVVDPELRAVGRAIAGTPLVVCGAEVFAKVFYAVDPGLRVEQILPDGETAERGDELWRVEGAACSILMGERTALNFVQRLSGIATLTRRYVDALPERARTRIADTRKTTPGLRFLERHAVRVGGGQNHRDALGCAVLIKDNHIAAAGSIESAIARARAGTPHTSRIEIEVETLEALEQALRAGADIVMLDNFEPDRIREAVQRVGGQALVEVSGNVGLDRVGPIASCGADVISVGALTHSAAAADIGLDLTLLT